MSEPTENEHPDFPPDEAEQEANSSEELEATYKGAPPSNLDEETLELYEKQMAEYRKSIEQEYALAEEKAQNVDESVKNAVEYFRKNTQAACAQVVFLMEHSSSDGVRLNASKYVIDRSFRGNSDSPGDPIADILKDLVVNQKPAGSLSTQNKP